MRKLAAALAAFLALTAAPAAAQFDASGTITTGGTPQQVFAARPGRVYLFCQNPITATETLFVNAPSAASTTGGSYELAPGGSLTFDIRVPQGAVSVVAATTGHRFICKEM